MAITYIAQSRVALTALALAMVLAGCANPATRSMRESQEGQDQTKDVLQHVQASTENSAVNVINDQWVDEDPIKAVPKDQHRLSDCQVRFEPKAPVGPDQFAQIISNGPCHFRVRFTSDALDHISGKGGRGATASIPGVPSSPYGTTAMLPPAGGVQATTYGLSDVTSGRTVGLNYSGPAATLFDQAANQLGVSWKETQDGEIVFLYTDTRTFRVDVTGGVRSMKSSVRSGTSTQNGSSGSSSGSGSSDQGGVSGQSGTTTSMDTSISTDFRKDFEETIKQMITPGLGRYAYSPMTGTLVVTDVPEVLSTINQVVETTNQVAGKQVLLNFTIVRYTSFKKDNNGVNWDLLFKSLNKNYGITLSNAFAGDPAGATGGVNILDTATGNAAKFAGSSVILNALAQQGNVSIVKRPSIVAINMQPTPLQIGSSVTYLARSDNTLTAGGTATGFSQNSLIPGTVTTGFNMTVMPFALSDGKSMVLDFTMDLSSLKALTPITSGNSMIQGPDVDQTSLTQKVKIRSGETLVMSGLEQNDNDGSKTGIGKPSFWAFGGGVTRNDTRDVLLLIVTPVLL